MKRKMTTLLPLVLLLLFWSVIVLLPFRLFAEKIGEGAAAASRILGLSGIFAVLVVWMAAMLIAMLILGIQRTRYAALSAGVIALSTLAYFLIGDIAANTFSRQSAVATAGLLIVFILLIFKADHLSGLLGRVYGISIAVMLLYGLTLKPLQSRLAPERTFPAFLDMDVFPFAQSFLAYDRPVHWIVTALLAGVSVLLVFLVSPAKQAKRDADYIN